VNQAPDARNTRSFRSVVAGAVVLAGLLLGGCAAQDISRVSITNESRSPIFFAAWVADGDIPGTEADIRLEARSSGGIAIEHPGERNVAVAIRVRADTPGAQPTTVRLEPPGPFLLRVGGDAERLTLQREEDVGADDNRVTPDPHQRGINDDIPRSNVRFQ
jgi:hypothetical protein